MMTPATYQCVTEGCSRGDCPNCLAVADLTARADRAELPFGAETLIGEWAQAKTCPGGRADDAMLELRAPGGLYLGCITLGWFRAHTTVGLYEAAILDNRREDADASPMGGAAR